MIQPQLKVFGWGCAGLIAVLLLLTVIIGLSCLLFKLLSVMLTAIGAWIACLVLLYWMGRTLCSIPVYAGSFWFVRRAIQVMSCTAAASHLHWELVQLHSIMSKAEPEMGQDPYKVKELAEVIARVKLLVD